MKFFEVKSPYYYALIAAKNEEECAELYEQVVSTLRMQPIKLLQL
ncbi:TPA: hypothetical protein QFN82_002595 [Enterococcus faecium]